MQYVHWRLRYSGSYDPRLVLARFGREASSCPLRQFFRGSHQPVCTRKFLLEDVACLTQRSSVFSAGSLKRWPG